MANCIQCGRKLPPLTLGRKICQWCVQHEAAQRGDAAEDARQVVIPAPWVRQEATVSLAHVIVGANVAVFIAMVLAAGSADFSGALLIHFGANYGPLTLSGQWWRLLSYMFVHGGFFHIAMNMWALWNLGGLCESLYGRWTSASIYLITGIAGGLGTLAWHPLVPSVGASGAIFGLAGALIASFYLGEFSLSGISIKSTLSSLLFFAGFSLFFGGMFPGIDNACHIGGLLIGLLLGALIARVAPHRDDATRRVGILLLVSLIVVGSALGIQRWRGSVVRYGISTLSPGQNLDRMIAELKKKVEQNPQDASAHYALAHHYFTKGEWADGGNELKRVLELQPQNTRARMGLGEAYLNQQQPKDAQQEFAKVVAQEPDNADAHVGLAMALAEQQDHKSAIAEYQSALRLDPQAQGVYYQMGISQAQLKQYDEAIASYLKERDQSGDAPQLETALAEAYQAKGMAQESQAARDKAAQMNATQ